MQTERDAFRDLLAIILGTGFQGGSGPVQESTIDSARRAGQIFRDMVQQRAALIEVAHYNAADANALIQDNYAGDANAAVNEAVRMIQAAQQTPAPHVPSRRGTGPSTIPHGEQ